MEFPKRERRRFYIEEYKRGEMSMDEALKRTGYDQDTFNRICELRSDRHKFHHEEVRPEVWEQFQTEAIRLYCQGENAVSIARSYGVSVNMVKHAFKSQSDRIHFNYGLRLNKKSPALDRYIWKKLNSYQGRNCGYMVEWM